MSIEVAASMKAADIALALLEFCDDWQPKSPMDAAATFEMVHELVLGAMGLAVARSEEDEPEKAH